MNEIKCPNCGEVFTVNESQYAELLSQVRTAEFDKELHDRMKQELALAEQKAMNEQQTKLAQKDQEIAQLQSQIQNFDTEKELAKKEVEQTSHQALLAKDKEVQALENQLATLRLEHENQLQKTLSDLEKERDQVKNQLLLQEKENELSLASIKQNYEAQLKAASEQVEFYKNFKAQQSTKAIGESLEHYAESEFNKVRSFAFPNAYFEKDNKVSARGSKGDFIFRESDGNDFDSIFITLTEDKVPLRPTRRDLVILFKVGIWKGKTADLVKLTFSIVFQTFPYGLGRLLGFEILIELDLFTGCFELGFVVLLN